MKNEKKFNNFGKGICKKCEENEKNLKKAHKINIIALAKHHRRTCKDSNCNVSLILLRKMAECYGIKFTKKEIETFI